MINKLTNKWDESGLLQDLTDNERVEMSNILNNTEKLLISTNTTNVLCGYFISVVSRIYRETKNKNICVESIFVEFSRYINEHIKPTNHDISADMECEIIANYVDKFLENNKT